jgi:hypothetical protein
LRSALLPLLPCRDIKPENLLLLKTDKEPVLKVIDYGCSTFCVPGKRLCKKFGTVSCSSSNCSRLDLVARMDRQPQQHQLQQQHYPCRQHPGV